MSEVSYIEFEKEKLIFGEISVFETKTTSGPVSTSRMHIGYDDRSYIQMQLPIASFSVYPPKEEDRVNNGKASVMMQFDNQATKKINDKLGMKEYSEYDKYLDTMDSMVESIIEHLIEDKQRLETFKVPYTKTGSDRKPVPIDTEVLKQNLKESLTSSVYYIPMEEKNYKYSTYADIVLPSDDEGNKKPTTRFTNLKGKEISSASL